MSLPFRLFTFGFFIVLLAAMVEGRFNVGHSLFLRYKDAKIRSKICRNLPLEHANICRFEPMGIFSKNNKSKIDNKIGGNKLSDFHFGKRFHIVTSEI